jgi:aminoglycoside phosphotransferase family enzyme/predicted kinase
MPTPSPAHVVEDQSEVFDFLADPRTYGLADVTRIDTQSAVVFLAGDDAYKVKRAVRFPFMDLSTRDKRKAACEAEIAVNVDNAPSIYLEVLSIARDVNGLKLGGTGKPVDWVVHMRRFDESRTLDHVAEAGGLTPKLIAPLVGAILASHARAPRRDGVAATASLRRYIEQNNEAFAESPELFPAERVQALTRRARETFAQILDLLLERGEAGFVRRCHGDLHLRNLVLLGDEPTLFDAVEFDDAIATCDVLYDLAYLLMDLWERGLKAEANLVMNRYLWGSDEAHLHGLAALPFFLSLRAGIRAKVVAAGLSHLEGEECERMAAEARRYFAAAEAFLEPVAPRVIAIGGLSGSGKSTLAAKLAPHLGRAPGAVHLRSDIERKRLTGAAEIERLPAEAYTPAATEKVYAALRRQARLAATAGCGVVVDAVHGLPAEREAIAATAAEAGASFAGLWLDAPLEVLVERVRERSGDASDATPDVVKAQAGADLGPIAWSRLDAAHEPDKALERALALIR